VHFSFDFDSAHENVTVWSAAACYRFAWSLTKVFYRQNKGGGASLG